MSFRLLTHGTFNGPSEQSTTSDTVGTLGKGTHNVLVHPNRGWIFTPEMFNGHIGLYLVITVDGDELDLCADKFQYDENEQVVSFELTPGAQYYLKTDTDFVGTGVDIYIITRD